jgi:hypothetical protein
LYIPITVAVATLLLVTAVWLVQWNNQRMRDNSFRVAIEQQITALNAPSSLRENPPQMVSVVLPSVSLRSANSLAEIRPQAGYRLLELQLLWPQKGEFQSYRAVLRRVRGREEFTIANLHAENNSVGKVVRFRLPAESLARGHYEISLSGIPNGPTEQYDFVIAD